MTTVVTDEAGAARASLGLVPITVPSKTAMLAEAEARLEAGQGFRVATLNLDHMVKLRQDPAFRAAYLQHDLVTADGNPVVALSRLAGEPVDLVPGSELVEPLCALAARLGVPVAFFGSRDTILEAAADALAARFPGLKITARIAPPMGFDPAGPAAEVAARDIAASGAGLCFLALGAPKQEIFAARAATLAPQVGFVSVGAGLDFIAGAQVRAPRWLRRLALEWLWRLLRNPRRLVMRYAACFAILPGVAWQAWRLGRAARAETRT